MNVLALGLLSLSLAGLSPADEVSIQNTMANGTRSQVDQAIEKIRFAGTPIGVVRNLSALVMRGPTLARQNASYALGILHHAEATDALIAATRDDDPVVRQNAAVALDRLKAKSAVAALSKLLVDPSPPVRRDAVKALGDIGDKKAFAALKGALEDSNAETRQAAILALGQLGDARAVPLLTPKMKDPSESTRLAAVKALCLLGNADGEKEAAKLLHSADALERKDGARLLEGVKSKWSTAELAKLLDDKDFGVQTAAAKSLARSGDGRGVQWLVVTAEKAEPQQRLKLETVIEEIGLTPADRKKILAASK